MAKRFDGMKREVWCKRLAKFDGTNLTVAEFCRREQVSQTSFYYWSKRIRQAGNGEATQCPLREAFATTSPEEGPKDFVEVVVSDSIRVRMRSDRLGAVATLIRYLQEASQNIDVSLLNSRFQRIDLASPTTQS